MKALFDEKTRSRLDDLRAAFCEFFGTGGLLRIFFPAFGVFQNSC